MMEPDDGNDYLTEMLSFVESYNSLCLTNFEYYVKIVGTTVIVRRSQDSDEYKEALGSAYVFDNTSLEKPSETFTKKIIINRSSMLSRYKSTTTEIEAYTNDDFYLLGDQIEFKSRGFHYKYKVSEIDRFDPNSMTKLFKLTLSGFEEFKTET